MTVDNALLAGFAQTRRRIGAIILDLLWKTVWLVVTASMFFAGMVWLNNKVGSVQINGGISALRNPLALFILLHHIWTRYASTIPWLLLVFTALSISVWMILEAYFRAGLLLPSRESFIRKASRNFLVFIASAAMKQLLMVSSCVLLGAIVFGRYLATPISRWRVLWPHSAGGAVVSVFICVILWFALTVLETAIRADALELLGQDLFLVVGIMAVLIGFEILVAASVLTLIFISAAAVSATASALFLFGAVLASIVLLSVLHSYLLVVRYSSITSLRGPV